MLMGNQVAPVPSQFMLIWCPRVEHAVCEEYKHSASVQPLLLLLRLVGCGTG